MVSLEVRTVILCLFTHVRMCESDGWTQKKREERDHLSMVACDRIRQTDMWREREKEREREREREREESAKGHFI